ncbi:hypothetical protein LI056_14930 [Clostridium perfringens]|uniref:hypothetical protein n=1 Tax=Clostridium perfringens TaxID=1502 RepID=UPI002247CA6F|nr:hypothetical protein [Clostridium perfringens]MCX0359276.1 hypothetical protein [Clostridium perfringens]MCX0420731.1 hypothetical protein [Clostridium perfringens]BDA26871.1 hypothetical protein CPBEC3_00060 [Clostridium perfringens]HCG3171042.1 hypothetical protein [Clostridium perfringens]
MENTYSTPMIKPVSAEPRAIKPGVAVPVAAIYAAAVTTVAAWVQFAAHSAVVFWTATWVA